MILSLFPGIGLIDMAFEEEGFCVFRGPDVLWGGDIRRFHPPAGHFAGVIGGPPCQSFSSLVHLVRANGHEPRFGNLIPEFERCVVEAQPDWFVMENVPAAPEPIVPGYGIKSFLLDNSALMGEDGFGLEQRRVRRFSFGMRGRNNDQVPSLLRWIDLAVFLLPDAAVPPSVHDKRREKAVFGDGRPTRRECRHPPVTAGHEQPAGLTARKRSKAVSSSNGVNGSERQTAGAGNGGRGRYKLADAIRLQGLPEDFLKDAPFTAEGKLKAVANGVPIPMGRAIARAIKEAIK